MRAAVLLAVALALAGCAMPRAQRGAFAATIKAQAARRVIPVTTAAVITFRNDESGAAVVAAAGTYFSPWTGLPESVAFVPAFYCNESCARNTAAHELGHVLGVPHGARYDAWLWPWQEPTRGLIEHPSADELVAARECLYDVELVPDATMTPPFRDALRWGAGAWNRALGRAAFEVRR